MKQIMIIVLPVILSACDSSGASCGLMGDVDRNGAVAPADAALALDISLGRYVANECEMYRADFDNDGHITSKDAEAILADFLGK